MDLVALQHVGSSRTRDWTCVPCIGRWILNHCTTREVPIIVFSLTLKRILSFLWFLHSFLFLHSLNSCGLWKWYPFEFCVCDYWYITSKVIQLTCFVLDKFPGNPVVGLSTLWGPFLSEQAFCVQRLLLLAREQSHPTHIACQWRDQHPTKVIGKLL